MMSKIYPVKLSTENTESTEITKNSMHFSVYSVFSVDQAFPGIGWGQKTYPFCRIYNQKWS